MPDAPIERARARCGWGRVEWKRPHLRARHSRHAPGSRRRRQGIRCRPRGAGLRDVGIVHGIVDLGGDLTVVGAHADRSPWLARHQGAARHEPRSHRSNCRRRTCDERDYERAVIVDGRRYSHIVDPVWLSDRKFCQRQRGRRQLPRRWSGIHARHAARFAGRP